MPQQKTVNIELGGKVRTMRLDLNALCALDENGQDVETLKGQLAGNRARISTIRLMLFAFLVTDSEDKGEPVSLKTVGKWVDLENVGYCAGKLAEFITGQPKDKAEPENPTQAATAAQ